MSMEPSDYTPIKSVTIDVSAANWTPTKPYRTVALWVGTGGDVTARLRDDTADVVFKNVPSGSYLHGDFILITTATTAADIVGQTVRIWGGPVRSS